MYHSILYGMLNKHWLSSYCRKKHRRVKPQNLVKKSIFSNLSNLIYEREQLRILILYFPEFDDTKKKSNSSIKGIKKMKITKKEQDANPTLVQHLDKVGMFLN